MKVRGIVVEELEVEEIEVHGLSYYTDSNVKPVLKNELEHLVFDGTVSPDVMEVGNGDTY